MTIVGEIADIRRDLESPPPATIYEPIQQTTSFLNNNLLVRTKDDPLSALPAIRSIVHAFDPDQAIVPETLEARFAAIMAPHRFILGLVGVFSTVALGLAALGIYGLFAESVAERVPEIGVRLALGATTTAVLRLILAEGARLIAIGLVAGVVGALALHRTMTTLVFGVATTDPATYLAAAIVLAAAALAACAIPARRAARVDPVRALRQE